VRAGCRRDASQRSNSALKIMFHSIAIADIGKAGLPAVKAYLGVH